MNIFILVALIALLGANKTPILPKPVGSEDTDHSGADPVLQGTIEFIGVEKWRGDLGRFFGIKDRDYYVRVSGYKSNGNGGVKALSVRTPDRDYSNSMQSMMDWGTSIYTKNGGMNQLVWTVKESANFRSLGAKEAQFKGRWSWTIDLAKGFVAQALGIPVDLVKV